jgi:hypothetical protein
VDDLTIDQLRLLSDHDIEYWRLSDDLLAQLATGYDQFVATSALYELSKRRSDRAAQVAREILRQQIADHFLRGSALGVLFKFEPAEAIDAIRRMIGSADDVLVRSVIELIQEERPAFTSEPGLSAARAVAARARELGPPDDAEDAAEREKFLAVYPA